MDGDRYVQKRMQVEWQKVLANREVRSQAGIKGMANRWHGHNSTSNPAIANGVTKNNLSSSSSISSSISNSGTNDDDGAKYISFSEKDLSEIRAKANRFREIVNLANRDDRNLVAKVAVLWHGQALTDDDVEQVLESFDRKKGISNPGAWIHRCLANRCKGRPESFEQLLAGTSLPPELEADR